MIHIENLKKYYGTFPAVDDISFDVANGEILGFLGPNGAGKSTTMKVLTGYYPPSEGKVTIEGMDVTEQSIETRKLIGYLPESNPLYFELSVYEYLKHIAEMRELPKEKHNARIKEMAELTGLQDRLGQQIAQLSKGYKQRVGLAQAMLHDPKLLILDEPTIGLDPNQIIEIRSLIKKLGSEKTVILSTHILPEVQATCDRVVIINRGKLEADGTLDELQHKFQGRPIIDIEVLGDGANDLDIYRKVTGVEEVTERHLPDLKGVAIRIAAASNTDPREEIFKLCVEKKWTLLTMNREIQSLENIFQQLTRAESGKEVAA
ncbi:ATP-binding cassette domain-containing protein [bacterium]|nr:ATP-binding cassette domain-containing protein [bacterium]